MSTAFAPSYSDDAVALPERCCTRLADHDLRDIQALSTAIPYCDVVVTDRKAWDAATKRAHLDTEFDTTILCTLEALAEYLDM